MNRTETRKPSIRVEDNDFGGRDYRSPEGMVRLAVEDEERIVYAFDTNTFCRWEARFSPGTPTRIVERTVDAALSEIGLGRMDGHLITLPA